MDSEKGEKDGSRGPLEVGPESLEAFPQSADVARDLLQENEMLRCRVSELEENIKERTGSGSGGQNGPDEEETRNKLALCESRLKDLQERIWEVEAENVDFARRYVDVEERNNNLANLYVASNQLHSTLDYGEVLQIVVEIMINLIGAEVFCIYLLDRKAGTLVPEAAEGIALSDVPTVGMGEGVIGKAAQTGESYFNETPAQSLKDRLLNPMVCIPLTIKDDVIGVVALYRLLSQKSRFAPVDYQLFTLLAGHAATAIFSSRLFSESRRKLDTYQGFLGLLTR